MWGVARMGAIVTNSGRTLASFIRRVLCCMPSNANELGVCVGLKIGKWSSKNEAKRELKFDHTVFVSIDTMKVVRECLNHTIPGPGG